MRATELMSTVPGITMDHLHNWERQGYLAPSRITVGKKRIRNYNEQEVHLIRAMWTYYRRGLSPKNAYRYAATEVAKGSYPVSPGGNGRGKDRERETRVYEGIAIIDLAIPLRHYFHLKMGGKERSWIINS
jgi:DNA-binding transcriptional MerR regulator